MFYKKYMGKLLRICYTSYIYKKAATYMCLQKRG